MEGPGGALAHGKPTPLGKGRELLHGGGKGAGAVWWMIPGTPMTSRRAEREARGMAVSVIEVQPISCVQTGISWPKAGKSRRDKETRLPGLWFSPDTSTLTGCPGDGGGSDWITCVGGWGGGMARRSAAAAEGRAKARAGTPSCPSIRNGPSLSEKLNRGARGHSGDNGECPLPWLPPPYSRGFDDPM